MCVHKLDVKCEQLAGKHSDTHDKYETKPPQRTNGYIVRYSPLNSDLDSQCNCHTYFIFDTLFSKRIRKQKSQKQAK